VARSAPLMASKPCDRFWNGTHELCGPALLIPGLGKCGTNALTKYLQMHPRVRNTDFFNPNNSEAMFDPRDVSPTAFVRMHNPDVTPNDPLVWIAKHPGLENRNADLLARRLRRHFPSSAIALSLCNPMQRAFRFFVHFMDQELRLHGKRVHLAKFNYAVLKRRFNITVTELFSSIWSIRTDCVLTACQEFALARPCRPESGAQAKGCITPGARRQSPTHALRHTQVRPTRAWRIVATLRSEGYFVPPNWFMNDDWDPAGQGICDPLVAKDTHFDRWVEDWLTSGYTINKTLSVVHMENWRRHGASYIRQVLRMLRLPEEEYPWDRAEAAFTRPVFEGEARRRYFKKGAPDSDISRPLMTRQCPQLEALTGVLPPWCPGGDASVARRARRRSQAGKATQLS
jgi:hypothetical protein